MLYICMYEYMYIDMYRERGREKTERTSIIMFPDGASPSWLPSFRLVAWNLVPELRNLVLKPRNLVLEPRSLVLEPRNLALEPRNRVFLEGFGYSFERIFFGRIFFRNNILSKEYSFAKIFLRKNILPKEYFFENI